MIELEISPSIKLTYCTNSKVLTILSPDTIRSYNLSSIKELVVTLDPEYYGQKGARLYIQANKNQLVSGMYLENPIKHEDILQFINSAYLDSQIPTNHITL